MLVAIVFHAYFDVDVEELLKERKLYVCDKVSLLVDKVIKLLGFDDWVTLRENQRLKSELNHSIAYQDIYKILKR